MCNNIDGARICYVEYGIEVFERFLNKKIHGQANYRKKRENEKKTRNEDE